MVQDLIQSRTAGVDFHADAEGTQRETAPRLGHPGGVRRLRTPGQRA